MDFNSKIITKQYQGFLNTKLLWVDKLLNLEQLLVPETSTISFQGAISLNKRLGKRVESFVFYYLNTFKNIEIKKQNIQIQQGNRTIGELDCLLEYNHQPIHLEIIYKFYLYDKTVGTTEIEHWIGPNKKDSLIQKLTKLKEKQLPLLYKEECKSLLDELNFDIRIIQQKVFFKAQLFVPYSNQNIVFEQLNSDCVCGFYIYQHELSQFKNAKFYIPTKLNWLIEPHKNVTWVKYIDFVKAVVEVLNDKTSPLCWLKKTNGEIYKFFIVWW